MSQPRRLPRARLRAVLDAASVPTWSAPAETGGLQFRPSPGRLPGGLRIYAIGDVRGDLDELIALTAAIEADLEARPIARAVLVYLGNLIGPGPDSAGVLRAVAAPPLRRVLLRGDIEQMLLHALAGDRPAATDWLHAGGAACLESWGLASDTPREDWPRLIPAEHVALLGEMKLSWRAGDYLFAHAGVRPGVPLDRQAPEDLIGIRQPFLASEQDHGAVIVHGHHAAPRPELRANRIGLDTGAGIGGMLTGAVLESDGIGILGSAAGSLAPAHPPT